MNYNQNHKIAQITPETLIVGIDIAKHHHVASAQDFRGIELDSTCFFDNTNDGFQYFLNWINGVKTKCDMNQIIVGMEPTGDYWLNLAHILKEENIKFVSVNPLHVKRSKELDDNSPTKNDVKDAKVIAQLVKDGRYTEPSIPQGVFAELRVAKKLRDLLNVDLQMLQGQVHNWIDRYFPEFFTVFKSWEGKSALHFLKLEPLPSELMKYSDEELLSSLRQVVKKSIGIKKIKALKEAASTSIGIGQGTSMARLELKSLLELYDLVQKKFGELDLQVDQMLQDITGVNQMLDIKGIGRDTAAVFFAEVRDLHQYHHPRQITKLAGLSLKENTYGKHKGQTKISKRGRKKLRALLFRACMILVAKNKAFKALHLYYTTRQNNPLKKMQSLIALCNKLIRILYSIGKKQFDFQEEKMLKDIPHMQPLLLQSVA